MSSHVRTISLRDEHIRYLKRNHIALSRLIQEVLNHRIYLEKNDAELRLKKR
jgi:hypothetical protein